MSVGRNEPCPCGSGKKYKRCCLVEEERTRTPPGQGLHELDHRLFVDMGKWARRRFEAAMAAIYDDYPVDVAEHDEHLQLFAAWAAYERKVEGRPLASWYLEERGRHLMPHERDWLTAQLQSWLSAWEVLEVERGTSVWLKDLLTGAERTVSEVSGSMTLSSHLLVLARVVDCSGLSLLVGMHPAPLPPEAGHETVARIRDELQLGKLASPTQLREGDCPTRLVDIWQAAVEELENRPLPRLQNTDGEDLVLIEDHYRLAGTAARAAAEAKLGNLADVEAPEPGQRQRHYRVVRQNDASARMESTLIGTILVKAREVVVEVNSRQRADRLRSRLEELLGERLRFDRRDELDALDAMAEMADAPARPSKQPEDPEVDALLREFKSRNYATWPEDSLPALDGLTPREAAAQPKYRARLDTLLKEMEYQESREAPGRRFDFGPIRRSLGLG